MAILHITNPSQFRHLAGAKLVNSSLFSPNIPLYYADDCDSKWDGYCFRGRCFMMRSANRNSSDYQMGPNCECQPGWTGKRCQYIDLGSLSSQDHHDTSKLIARVVGLSFAGIILLAILAVGLFAYKRRRTLMTRGRANLEASFGTRSRLIHELRRKLWSRRLEAEGTCKFVNNDELRTDDHADVTAICRQKSPVPWFRSTADPSTTRFEVSVCPPVSPQQIKRDSVVSWAPGWEYSSTGPQSLSPESVV